MEGSSEEEWEILVGLEIKGRRWVYVLLVGQGDKRWVTPREMTLHRRLRGSNR